MAQVLRMADYTALPDAVAAGPAPMPTIDEKLHTQLVDDFEAAEESSRTNREKAERDHDYYHGKQWTETEVRDLGNRGQPAITLNLIRQKIDFLQGLERTQRTRPNAMPRTPIHEDDAHAVKDALGYLADSNVYDQTRSRVWEDLLIVGWGGVEQSLEKVHNPKPGQVARKLIYKRCQWDRMFWDPYSSEDDFSDAGYRGMVLWMDRDAAILAYGEGAAKVFDETVSTAQVGGTFDDKPKFTTWVQSGKRERVRIVQMYRLGADGEWDFWEFTKGGILKGGPSPWLDEDGKRTHCYDWATAFIDRDNNRYGVVRDMIDPQDEANKRRSKALHHYTSRQTFGTPEAQGAMSVREMRKQLARPDGHVQLPSGVEFGKQFGIIPTNDMASGHFELLQQVMGVFETMGPNASMQGKGSKSQSGRAILANQQGGAVQTGTLSDTLRNMDYRVYCRMWNGIRQWWTGETWVRVTDDPRNLRWVGLNAPKMQPIMHPVTGDQLIDPSTGQPAMAPLIDPATGQPILQNVVAQIGVDIEIGDAPDMGTMQDEQFALLVQLKSMDANGEVPFKALVEAMPNLRNKDKLLDAIDQKEQQPPNPLLVAQAQAKVADTQASAQQKQASAVKSLAEARLAPAKALHDAEIDHHAASVQVQLAALKAMQAFHPQPSEAPAF